MSSEFLDAQPVVVEVDLEVDKCTKFNYLIPGSFKSVANVYSEVPALTVRTQFSASALWARSIIFAISRTNLRPFVLELLKVSFASLRHLYGSFL